MMKNLWENVRHLFQLVISYISQNAFPQPTGEDFHALSCWLYVSYTTENYNSKMY